MDIENENENKNANEVFTNQVIDADIQALITGEEVKVIEITPEIKSLSNIHKYFANSISALNYLEITKNVLSQSVDQAIASGSLQSDDQILLDIQKTLDENSTIIEANVEKLVTLDESEYNIVKLLNKNENKLDLDTIVAIENLIEEIATELTSLKYMFLDLIKSIANHIGSEITADANRTFKIIEDSIDAAQEMNAFGLEDSAQRIGKNIKDNREAIYDTLDEAKSMSEELIGDIEKAKMASDFELEKSKFEDLQALGETLNVLKSKILGRDLTNGPEITSEIDDAIQYEELDENGNVVDAEEINDDSDNESVVYPDGEGILDDNAPAVESTELVITLNDYDEDISESDFRDIIFKKGLEYAEEFIFTLPKEKRTTYIAIIAEKQNEEIL